METSKPSSDKSRELLRSILALSLPSIVTNIAVPVLSITDTAIAGHIGDALTIAAVAVGGTMFNLIYWLCGFLRMGSSGPAAQAYGAGQTGECNQILCRGLLLAVGLGIGMIALQSPLARLLLRLIDADASTASIALRYFSICVWGAPAVLANYCFSGWFLGRQNTRVTMWVSLFMVVFNIAVSLTLVGVFRMGVEGIATGTLSAQWASCLIFMGAALRERSLEGVTRRGVFNLGALLRFFRINTDIFLRTVCLVTVTLWFTRTGARQSELMLAVNAVLMQLFTLFSFFMDGFAYAAEALCGMLAGAGQYGTLRLMVRRLLGVGVVFALVFSLIYLLCGTEIIGLISSDSRVVEGAGEYMGWAVTVPCAGFMAFIWDGVYVGLTRTREMLLSMGVATAVFFAVYAVAFPRMGNHGLWLAFVCYLFVRGLLLGLMSRRPGILSRIS